MTGRRPWTLAGKGNERGNMKEKRRDAIPADAGSLLNPFAGKRFRLPPEWRPCCIQGRSPPIYSSPIIAKRKICSANVLTILMVAAPCGFLRFE
jgi:hypothetical protein